jgi:hypothetical protein
MLSCTLLVAVIATGAGGGEGTIRKIEADTEVEKDLEIKAGGKLVVSAGVTLKFAPGAGVVCRGVLEVRGTAEKPVVFAAKDPDKGWANVVLLGAATAGSAIENCEFSGGRGRRIKFTAKGLFERFAEEDDKKNTLECGGAVFVYLTEKVTIRNCVFRKNKAFWGGAISCWGKASPLIERCRFTGNSAYWGGAVHCWGRSAARVRLCYFADNVGDRKNGDAGAVQFMNASDGRVEHCYFTGNSAKWGGAIHVLQQSKPTIAGNYIAGNRAWNNSSAVSCFGYANPTITGNYISGNHVEAEKGVAIATVAHSQPVIRGNYIRDNTNLKEKQANLDACPKFRGKPDKSTCDHREPAEKEKVLEALKKAGVLALAPKKAPQKKEADK